jgi:biotin transport system substrate-specific component
MNILPLVQLHSSLQAKLIKECGTIFLWIVGLALCAHVIIPFYPVPFTLQTFGLFILALCTPWKKTFSAIMAWIFFGMVGCPLFYAKGASILFGHTGGYVWGFLTVFPFLSYMFETFPSYGVRLCAGCVGAIVILALGCFYLNFFVESTQIAWQMGFVPFWLPDIIKTVCAVSLIHFGKKYVWEHHY